MIGVSGGFEIGSVNVHTTQNRGFTPDEIAERCLDKIISVAAPAKDIAPVPVVVVVSFTRSAMTKAMIMQS